MLFVNILSMWLVCPIGDFCNLKASPSPQKCKVKNFIRKAFAKQSNKSPFPPTSHTIVTRQGKQTATLTYIFGGKS